MKCGRFPLGIKCQTQEVHHHQLQKRKLKKETCWNGRKRQSGRSKDNAKQREMAAILIAKSRRSQIA